jgi:hypothetical protein
MMRTSLIVGLLAGLLLGLLLSTQRATSQEDHFPAPVYEGRGRYKIAGHSTYPPLLLDSETGTSWILMSTADGESRRWTWERIEMSGGPQNDSDGGERGVARVPQPPRDSKHQIFF